MNKLEEFKNWLASDSQTFCDKLIVFVKVKKEDRFYFLYEQFYGNELAFENLDFTGVYDRETAQLYVKSYSPDLIDMGCESIQFGDLRSERKGRVTKEIYRIIGNTIPKLGTKDMEDLYFLNRVKNVRLSAPDTARRLFVYDKNLSNQIEVHYSVNDRSASELLAYLVNPDEFCKKEAEQWVAEHQQDIYIAFIAMQEVRKSYYELISSKTDVNTVRTIIRAMKTIPDAKTVNIYLQKNGIDFHGKIDADVLRRDCTDTYSSYYLAAQDRQKYKKIFGHEDIKISDVVSITYGRKEIYRKEDV